MKLRSIVVTMMLSSLAIGITNCGSDGDGGGGTGNDGGTTSGNVPPPLAPGGDGGIVNTSCTKKTCADLGIECGPASDGCGGLIADCGKCEPPEICGGGGPSKCGGKSGCVPTTCENLGVECGPAGDGCGGLLDCGGCFGATLCGGGGPSKCGGGQVNDAGQVLYPDGGTCQPRTACETGECGPVADGCGGFLTCLANCPAGQTCGGGGTPSFCGGTTCTPSSSCASEGATCGFVANGCGAVENCGGATCPTVGHVCGAAGPNRCGPGVLVDAGNCTTGLCLDRPTNCPGGTNTTEITGTVYMPNGRLPVYDALVYVPNGTVADVPEGVRDGVCDTCAEEGSGDPISTARTNAEGKFTLRNMPYRTAAQGGVPVVIQAGRWRKRITINFDAADRCNTKSLSTAAVPQVADANNTTFGRTNTATNHIPRFAVTSGSADAMQCLLRKVGIDDAEFRHPGSGRVNLYSGGPAANDTSGTNRYRGTNGKGYSGTGAWAPASTTRSFPNQTFLFGTNGAATDTSKLDQYDAVILTCEGNDNPDNNDQDPDPGDRGTLWTNQYGGFRDEMKAYADRGGRVFTSHWHHAWIEHQATWGAAPNPLASIVHQNNPASGVRATINTTPAKGQALAAWLFNANTINGVTPEPFGEFLVYEGRRTVASVDETRATRLVSIPNGVQYFDFNTPVGAATQCGRFVNSDLHVSAGAGDSEGNGNCPGNESDGFPCNCTTDINTLSDQEKVLMFMLFDITSCIKPIDPVPQACVPKNCAEQGIQCGAAGDGCGAQIQCDPCPGGQVCRGAPGRCEPVTCQPIVCAPGQCGSIANGCGGTADCGPCTTPGQICGGGGPNTCGANSCTPQACPTGQECGPAGDGCGNVIQCGTCPPNQVCGGGGPGKCGAPACTPAICSQEQKCGFIADGCGASVNCGTCPPNNTCRDNKCVAGGVN